MNINKQHLPAVQAAKTKATEVEIIDPERAENKDQYSSDPVRRIKFHLAKARGYAIGALNHIIEAGQDLMRQKQIVGYGEWGNWCEKNLDIAQKTADRYIATYQRTVGVLRVQQGVAQDAPLRKKELKIATAGLEEKTVRQVMIELGVVKRPKGWGGEREGAGRKGDDAPLATRSAQDNAKEIWARALTMLSHKTTLAAIALLPEKETDVAWGVVKEIYEALKDHLKEF